jgi:hypothetical protein
MVYKHLSKSIDWTRSSQKNEMGRRNLACRAVIRKDMPMNLSIGAAIEASTSLARVPVPAVG